MNNFPFRKALLAGLLVGTLDIAAALTQFYIKTGKSPLIVLKYIASAVFGKEAYGGGDRMIVWGFVFHYLVALSFTFFFFWLVANVPALLTNRILTGIIYGIFAWATMRFLVLPLTKVPAAPFKLKDAAIAAAILIACIGLPLAFIAKRADTRRE